MNRSKRKLKFVAVVILAGFLAISQAILASDISIVGEINDRNELVSSDDGTVYKLAEGKIADKLIYEHRGEKMRVSGRLIRPVPMPLA